MDKLLKWFSRFLYGEKSNHVRLAIELNGTVRYIGTMGTVLRDKESPYYVLDNDTKVLTLNSEIYDRVSKKFNIKEWNKLQFSVLIVLCESKDLLDHAEKYDSWIQDVTIKQAI